jgi:8-oxo-dGTP pyrophosphatase MutT (NUDIX family)
VLFLRRAEQPGDPWSGQVSFPGGKQDHEDAGSDRRTAARETWEEIGVDLSSPRFVCLGQIDDRPAFSRGSRIDLSISTFVFEDTTPRQRQRQRQCSSLSSADAASFDLQLRLNLSEVSAARWVPSSELCADNVAWDGVEFPFARRVFPFLKIVPRALLESLGLFTLRFPSLPLHRLEGATADTGSPAVVDNGEDESDNGEGEQVPYNLWGLTFRITEDLLQFAGTRAEDTFTARHPPCLFPQTGLGALGNGVLKFLHRHNLKRSY